MDARTRLVASKPAHSTQVVVLMPARITVSAPSLYGTSARQVVRKDLVTGKRWWAHGPGGDDNPSAVPVVIWFEIHRKEKTPPEFIPHIIGESAGSGIGTCM